MTDLSGGLAALTDRLTQNDRSLDLCVERLKSAREDVAELEQRQRDLIAENKSINASIDALLEQSAGRSDYPRLCDPTFPVPDDEGSAVIAWLMVLVVFGAIVATCLYFAGQSDPRPYIERVGQSIGSAFGGVL